MVLYKVTSKWNIRDIIRMRRHKEALNKRVEVLFDYEKFSYLEDLARRQKTSVGNLIREAVTMVYMDADAKNSGKQYSG